MSAYIQFFIRGGNIFYPIATYNRSTAIYEKFQDNFPNLWETIVPVTDELLNKVMIDVRASVDDFYEGIHSYETKIEEVRKLENTSIEERMNFINEYIEMKNVYRQRITELEQCSFFIDMLHDMIYEAEDTKYYDTIETIDKNNYVYVGIEVGIPTVDMIKE